MSLPRGAWVRAFLVAAAAAVAMALPSTSGASVAVQMDVPALAAASARILTGRVLWSTSQWDDAGHIYTRWRVAVLEDIRGGGGAELDVVTWGGVVNGVGQWVPGSAALQVGGDAVLFLEDGPRVPGGPTMQVTGMAQGCWAVLDAGGPRARVVRRPSRLSLRPVGVNAGAVPALMDDAGSPAEAYGAFVARVRAALQQQAVRP